MTESFEIYAKDLKPKALQELLKFLGLKTIEEGNLEFNPIAIIEME